MPTTVLQVERIDHSRYSGKHGLFDDYLITGVEVGAYTVQLHTTSVLMASVFQRAKDLDRLVEVIWRDHRIGRVIIDVQLLQPQAGATA